MKQNPDLEIIMRYLQWWDPLNIMDDLVDAGIPLSEYDVYAREIHTLLESRVGFLKLKAKLEEIQNGMETKIDEDRISKLAEGLIRCFDEYEDLFY